MLYGYDPLYRLVGETNTAHDGWVPVQEVYYDTQPGHSDTDGYDKVGNRCKRTVWPEIDAFGTHAYAYTLNDRLVSDQYDDNGNTLRGEVSPVQVADDVYDLDNRLIRRNMEQHVIECVYDGDGNGVQKRFETPDGQSVTRTIYFLIDDRNLTGYAQVWEEVGYTPFGVAFNEDHRVYTYGHDLISQSRPSVVGSPIHFYGYDGHGSVRFLTDTAGTITDTYTYDAFGILIYIDGAGTPNNYLFAGEQWDPDLGMYYLRARYLDPVTGRFWTRDNFEGFQQDPYSLHKYLYASCDPINAVDPSGNWSLSELLVTGLQIARLGAHVGLRVAAAYDRAQWFKDGLVILGKLGKSGRVDAVASSLWAADFLPFKKAWDKIGVIGNRLIGASGPLQRAFKTIIEAGGRTKHAAKQIGEMGAAVVARKLGMKPTDFQPRYHGIDDIYENNGKFVIVEAKGGTGALDADQMSQGWINRKIKDLRITAIRGVIN